jgi:integrase
MLTLDQVRKLTRESGDKQHWHSDGRSLYLVTRQGKGFWVFHFRDPREGGAIRNTGLGSADDVTPAAARKARDKFMVDLRDGRPVAIGARKAKGELFGTCATAWLENHSTEWSTRTRSDNQALFAKYIPAAFNARPVTAITPEHVADVLRPIWIGPGNDKANRLRRMVEDVLKAKSVHPNPADWDGPLSSLLSRKRQEVTHHEAMAFADVPAFVAKLGDSIEDRAGRFVILTAVRRKEALGAMWAEFDLANRVWNIPKERMKMKRPHAVPLTDAMIEALGKPSEGLVFPSARTGGMLGHKSLDKTWVPNGYTLHGFRSSFATWAEEEDHGRRFPARVIDAALAHAKKDAEGERNEVTGAYQRSELFEARRKLMQAWSEFATGTK